MKNDKKQINEGLLKKERKIILARHGETDANANNDSIRGWIDWPLNDKGIEEAHRLGRDLKKEDFDLIICSDLQRTVKTAEIISEETGVPVAGKTEVLRPWDVGELTGKESKAVIPKMMEYVNEHPDEKVPEGESFNDFKMRYLNGLEKILRKFPKNKICLVAHHRNQVLLDAWVKAGCPSNGDFDHKVFNTKGIPPAEFAIYKVKE
jgi:broad specificity phosphatase PhoE